MRTSYLRNVWLKTRKLAGVAPLPEEMLGCIPDVADARDAIKSPVGLPMDSAYVSEVPPRFVINQGRAGSCAGCAAAHAIFILTGKTTKQQMRFLPAYLYIYYKVREMQGTVNSDTGSHLRNVMKVLKNGVPELDFHDWGDYWRKKPSESAEKNAVFSIKGYERIRSGAKAADTVCQVIGGEGLPVIVGSGIYSNAMRIAGRSGVMPMPDWENDRYLGGHAMTITGYKTGPDGARSFQLLNSWGSRWGKNGYFWVPEEFITNSEFTFDMWSFSRQYW